jgi:epsilon-lactone hydrolase
MSKKGISDSDSMTTPIISAEITFPEPRIDIETLHAIKVYPRREEMYAKLPCGYFCCVALCGGFCKCCSQNVVDISRNTCCCCCIPTKKPSWNRRFDLGVSLLSNTMYNVYPHEKSVPVMRVLADHEIFSWLPFFPRNVTVRSGRKPDGFLESLGHEWVFPSNEGYPDFEAESTKQRRFIIYLHGGAFAIGGPFTHRLLVAEMCKETGATVLVIVYRRAPEHKYPLAEIDCFNAYKWLASKINSNRIMLSGDSAGGALVIGTLVRIRNEGMPQARGGICLSPWVDLYENETESCRVNCFIDYIPPHLIPFAGQLYVDPPNARHSPTNQDLVGLPPLLVEIGEAEVLRDVILIFVKKAEAAGVHVEYNVYEDMVHVFQLLTITNQEQTRRSLRNIARFMDRIYADSIDILVPSSDVSLPPAAITTEPLKLVRSSSGDNNGYLPIKETEPSIDETHQPVEEAPTTGISSTTNVVEEDHISLEVDAADQPIITSDETSVNH